MTDASQQLVPKLRFPNFELPWKASPFSNLYNFFPTNSLSRNDLEEDNGGILNIHYGDIHTRLPSRLDTGTEKLPSVKSEKMAIADRQQPLAVGDLIFADASEDTADIGKVVEVVAIGGRKVVAGLHTIHARPKPETEAAVGFCTELFRSARVRRAIIRESQGAKVLGLSATKLGAIDIHFPTFPEQQRMSSFFGIIDEKLSLLERQKTLLADYKRGCTQQIFSRKIRFKDDHGNDFPDWEDTTIGEIGNFYYGKSAPKFSLSPDAATPCVRYGELYSRYGVVIENVESRTNIDPNQLKFSQGGEILVPRVGEAPLDFAASCSYLPHAGIAIGEMISVFNTDENPLFYTYYFRTLLKEFARVVEGGNVSNLYYSYLEPIKVGRPHPDEQIMIANFLTAIDLKLRLISEEVKHVKTFKKGLLQQMYV